MAKILNAKGEPVVLNAQEKYRAEYNQKKFNEEYQNSLGFQVDITTLTSVQKLVTTQKFFEIPPGDYMPVRVGDGAWNTFLTTYRSFDAAGKFEDGFINNGGQNDKLAVADAAIDAVTVPVRDWAKTVNYTLIEIAQASQSGNWDLVTAKERSRKKNWDLGVQEVAFLGVKGSSGSSAMLGLLNQNTVAVNTTDIAKPISTMDPAELKAVCAKLYEAYRTNSSRTAKPTHFIVPESDFNGMASQSSAEFPLKSVYQVLLETFQQITNNPSFKILPCAYADVAYSNGILTANRYVLLNYDMETLRMDIPVDYTNTLANSLNNFQYQSVGYGRLTGVGVYRPKELLYFDEPA